MKDRYYFYKIKAFNITIFIKNNFINYTDKNETLKIIKLDKYLEV